MLRKLGISIVGHDGAGKSTLARYLHECFPQSEVVSFATALKQELETEVAGVWSKPYTKIRRDILRFYGEGVRKYYNEQHWIDLLAKHIAAKSDIEIFICDDMRYITEMTYWFEQFEHVLLIGIESLEVTSKEALESPFQSVRECQQIIDFIRYNQDTPFIHAALLDVTEYSEYYPKSKAQFYTHEQTRNTFDKVVGNINEAIKAVTGTEFTTSSPGD